MRLNDEHYRLVRDILGKQGVALAYMFGSFARGTAGPLSDVDIGLIFRDHVPRPEYSKKESLIASEVGRALERKQVDIINLAVSDRPVLKHRVVFQGECLVSDDPKKQFALEQAILREYEDTAMLRRLQTVVRHKHIKNGTFGKPTFSIHSLNA